jgi:hypothetical protein
MGAIAMGFDGGRVDNEDSIFIVMYRLLALWQQSCGLY